MYLNFYSTIPFLKELDPININQVSSNKKKEINENVLLEK